jgi:hypothetical protein
MNLSLNTTWNLSWLGPSWLHLSWVSLSNPVAIWWIFLVTVCVANMLSWFQLCTFVRRAPPARGTARLFAAETPLFLSAAYVFGCAFRSVLPRADVQRICLFDTWLSSVLVGRSVATVAELCFAVQWAIVLYELGKITRSDTAKNIAWLVVPLIVVAECCSWYAVITTDFLGNVLENSLWTVTFMMIAIALVRLFFSFRGVARIALGAAAIGVAGYVVFMSCVDVPMYVSRWQAELADGMPTLGFFAGLHDLDTRWVVTHDIADWRLEIPWMSLYFSVAVWTSLALGGFGLIRHRLPAYRLRRPLIKATRRPVPVRIHTS